MLKKFEAFGDIKVDLLEFCQDHLVYLLDEDIYTLKVIDAEDFELVCKIVFHDNDLREGDIKWDLVKDHLIPFFHLLLKNYRLKTAPSWMGGRWGKSADENFFCLRINNTWRGFTLEELEGNYLELLHVETFSSLVIHVSGKKRN